MVPVFAESVSHDAPEAVHLNPPVPPDAEQVTEYGAPCSDEPPGAEQLIFNFGALTESRWLAMLSVRVGVVVSLKVAVKL